MSNHIYHVEQIRYSRAICSVNQALIWDIIKFNCEGENQYIFDIHKCTVTEAIEEIKDKDSIYAKYTDEEKEEALEVLNNFLELMKDEEFLLVATF